MRAENIRGVLVAIAIALLAGVFAAEDVSAAGTNAEYNQMAREFLEEYYDPDDFLDTAMYNYTNGYCRSGGYSDKDQLDAIYETAENVTKDALTDEAKIRAIHDWICQNIEYPQSQAGYNGYPDSALANPFTVYKTKSAVCYGFANLTELMLQHVGVPCLVVRGNGSAHVWNAVHVNGKWTFTDNTFDENYTASSGELSYRYYLMDDETYDAEYKTQFLECWTGDVCFFPLVVNPSKTYHEFTLNSKGGKCIARRPFPEGTTKELLPLPNREGREFIRWTNSQNIKGYKYSGGWYAYGNAASEDTPASGLAAVTEDVTMTASYVKVDPQYDVPEDLSVREGHSLYEILLPEGFEWTSSDTVLETPGEYTYQAKYVPEDTDDYNTVQGIEIHITVTKDFEKRLAKAEQELRQAQEALQQAETLKAEAEQQVSQLRDALAAQQAASEGLQTELDEETSLNESLQAQLADKIRELQAKEVQYSEAITDAEQRISEAEAAYSKLKTETDAERTAANARLEEANARILQLTQEKEALQADIDALGRSLQEQGEQWSNERAGYEILLDQANSDLASLEETLKQERQAAQNASAQLQEANANLTLLQSDNSALQRAIESLGTQIDEKKQTIEDLQKQIEKLQEDVESLTQQNNRLQEQISSLQKTLDEANQMISNLQQRIRSLEAGMSQSEEEMIAQIQTLQKTLEQTEEELESARTLAQQESSEKEEAEALVASLQEANQGLQGLVDSLTQQMEQERASSEQMQSERDALKKQADEAKSALEEANRRIQELQQKLEECGQPGDDPEKPKKQIEANLSGSTFTFSGKAVTPGVLPETLIEGKDYTIQYIQNDAIGKAKAVITGTGDYTGSITREFTILPPNGSIARVAPAKKTVTITAKAAPGGVKYQYAVKYNGKWKYYSSSKAKKTVTNLKSKSRVKVKVRCYKTVSGETYRGAFSSAKTVTIK